MQKSFWWKQKGPNFKMFQFEVLLTFIPNSLCTLHDTTHNFESGSSILLWRQSKRYF